MRGQLTPPQSAQGITNPVGHGQNLTRQVDDRTGQLHYCIKGQMRRDCQGRRQPDQVEPVIASMSVRYGQITTYKTCHAAKDQCAGSFDAIRPVLWRAIDFKNVALVSQDKNFAGRHKNPVAVTAAHNAQLV